MQLLFLACVLGMFLMAPVHFLSVEHRKLQNKYGKERGTRIGEICGLVSGWGLFIFWIGVWTSPQPRFAIPTSQNLSSLLPLLHIVVCLAFLLPGTWLAIKGVRETTLRTAETHRTERIVTTGAYSIVRHPQYLGGLLAHFGISFLLSAWYSLLVTPLLAVLIFFISKKEEEELIIEFGEEYGNYRKKVPMLIPKLKRERMSPTRHNRDAPAIAFSFM